MVDAVDVVGESRWLVGRKEAERPQTMQGGEREPHHHRSRSPGN